MTKKHNPQRIYFYQAIGEGGDVMREYLFFSLDDALQQLEKDESDFILSDTPLFDTESKFVISLPTPKQLRRLTKRGVSVY
jgi:hypothetical protein